MPWPTPRDWLFGCKSFAAAMLALFIAFAVGLERPYWALASAYIASQPLTGATVSKALYRGIGTVVGAAAAVALVPPLSQAPVLLSLALALWVGACLFVALLDRTNRGYASMLAGFTAAIIGFPSVAAPDQVFTTALTRAQEIGIGIAVATIVHSIVLPRSTTVVLGQRIEIWMNNARVWARLALSGGGDSERLVRRLAGDAVEIDALAENLPFEATPWQVSRFTLLRERMVMLLPILAAIEDRLEALRRLESPPEEADALAAVVTGWIAEGQPPSEPLLDQIASAEAAVAQRTDWPSLMVSNLLTRLRELVLVLSDCTILQQQMQRPDGIAVGLRFSPEGSATLTWHRDPALALLSAVAAIVAVLICCTAWIATAWPDGAIAAEMVAVACSFFATRDDPVPAILSFLRWSLLGIVVDGIILFAFLPAATTFVGLMLVLAPFYILGGVLASMPATSNGGRAFTANGATLLAFSPTYNADFQTFANGGLAFLLGLILAALVTRLIRSVGAEASANRLQRRIWLDVAVAAETRGNRDRARYAGLMLDRLGRLAPRLAVSDAQAADALNEALGDLRVGLNIIDLRRARHDIGDTARAGIDRMLDALAAAYRTRTHRTPGAVSRGKLLARIDAALREAARVGPGPGRAAALLGLVGIRRALFPREGAFAAPPP
jgi:uncharacterized membrane protein YccC